MLRKRPLLCGGLFFISILIFWVSCIGITLSPALVSQYFPQFQISSLKLFLFREFSLVSLYAKDVHVAHAQGVFDIKKAVVCLSERALLRKKIIPRQVIVDGLHFSEEVLSQPLGQSSLTELLPPVTFIIRDATILYQGNVWKVQQLALIPEESLSDGQFSFRARGPLELEATLQQRESLWEINFRSLWIKDPAFKKLLDLNVPLHGQLTISFHDEGVSYQGVFQAQDNGKLNINQLYPNSVPFSQFSGAFSGKNLDLESHIVLQTPGPFVEFDVRTYVEAGQKKPALTLKGNLKGFNVDQFGAFWPPQLGFDTRQWILTHLSNGQVPRADVHVTLSPSTEGAYHLSHLEGTMDIENMTVAYLSGMPAVHQVAGKAYYDHEKFDIDVYKGVLDTLTVAGGQLLFYNLNTPQGQAEITLSIIGPIRQAVAVADHPPLKYPSALGITPDMVDGDAQIKLSLDFPLRETITPRDVLVTTQARISQFMFLRPFDVLNKPETLKSDMAHFLLTNKGLTLSGESVLAGIPLVWAWRETFSPSPKKNIAPRKLSFSTVLTDTHLKEKGLLTQNQLKGSVSVEGSINISTRGKKSFAIHANGLNAEVNFGGIFEKKQNESAQLSFSWKDPSSHASLFPVTAHYRDGKIQTDGVLWINTRTLHIARVHLPHLQIGGSKCQLSWAPTATQGWIATISGDTLDISSFLKARHDPASAARATTTLEAPWTGMIDVDVKKLRINDNQTIENVRGTLLHEKNQWEKIWLTTGSNQTQVSLQRPAIAPDKQAPANRVLEIKSTQAGAIFALLSDSGKLKTGRLHARFEEVDGAHHPWRGTAKVMDAQVMDMPLLARVLSLISPMAVVDLLSGKGMVFNSISTDIYIDDHVVKLSDGHATSLALGLTFDGSLGRFSDAIYLQGEVIPAYALNSLFGRIPLLGEIIAGGRGKGIFAARYEISGTLEKPETQVNPLSLFAPGFIRKFFERNPPKIKAKEKEH